MPLKRKMHGYLLTIIPPFDPNIQLPLCGFYESSVTGSNLLHLVNMVFFPPIELSLWRVWGGTSVPTKDTHESVVFTLS